MTLIPLKFTRDSELGRRTDWPFGSFQKEMNRLVEDFFSDRDGLATWGGSKGSFNPSIDVVEGEKDFQVQVELPGLEEKDVEISFSQNALMLKGEKRQSHEEKSKSLHRIERSYGSFYRVIPFATEIDDSRIEAEFQKGVLHVTLPKAAQAIKDTKKIQIKTRS